jgi:hypothetical protein
LAMPDEDPAQRQPAAPQGNSKSWEFRQSSYSARN